LLRVRIEFLSEVLIGKLYFDQKFLKNERKFEVATLFRLYHNSPELAQKIDDHDTLVLRKKGTMRT